MIADVLEIRELAADGSQRDLTMRSQIIGACAVAVVIMSGRDFSTQDKTPRSLTFAEFKGYGTHGGRA